MATSGPVRAFLSYAHEDHAWRAAVLKHIGWLSHTHQLDTFDDRELKPGELWDEWIGKELERADIVIALMQGRDLDADRQAERGAGEARDHAAVRDQPDAVREGGDVSAHRPARSHGDHGKAGARLP